MRCKYAELSLVALSHPHVCDDGRVLPEGAEGVVVYAWHGGDGYEVEFERPFHCVATLGPSELRQAGRRYAIRTVGQYCSPKNKKRAALVYLGWFYVTDETRKAVDRQISVYFPERAQAERCLAVLIAGDLRHE